MAAAPKKRIWAWAFFDFSNSAFGALVTTFLYATYYVKAIAPDEVSGAAQWASVVGLSSLAIGLLAPSLGALADAYSWKKRFMGFFLLTGCAATALLYFPQSEMAWVALLLFFVANVGIELSIVFNNAFLPELAPKERLGKISGLAWAFGYFGAMLCLVLALVGFVMTDDPWLGFSLDDGENIRATNLLVAVWMAVFALPMLLMVPEQRAPQSSASLLRLVGEGWERLRSTFLGMRAYRSIFWLLIARLLYNDGIATVFALGGIFAAGVFGFTFQETLIFGIAMNVVAGFGALAFSFVEDRIGSRMTIAVSVAAMMLSSAIAITVESKDAFWACALFLGFFVGPTQSASRAYLARLCPADKTNEFFGFFALSGKLTAFAGPLICGQLTLLFHSQRIGMIVVPALLCAGLITLWLKLPSDRVA